MDTGLIGLKVVALSIVKRDTFTGTVVEQGENYLDIDDGTGLAWRIFDNAGWRVERAEDRVYLFGQRELSFDNYKYPALVNGLW